MDVDEDHDNDNSVHPRWEELVEWLESHGMNISPEKLPVVARFSPGAGYGLFAIKQIGPSSRLFDIPAKALLNHLTLGPHYPLTKPKLTCTQIVSLHLMLYRPGDDDICLDPLFGPYISVLPRNFDTHPVTWLWKSKRDHSGALESQMIAALPERVLQKLQKIMDLYDQDWMRTRNYLGNNPILIERKARFLRPLALDELEIDYLWGWLTVNTRCIYHRLANSRSDKNNMTLCPILDFANHTTKEPYTKPETTQAELWNTGPSAKRKFGDNFILLSPTAPSEAGDELLLRYGLHSNATLFCEYGFVDQLSNGSTSEVANSEIELISAVEKLFDERGQIGSWMKDVLVEEGYWGDWTLHAWPAPAHPSYRLITVLRMYCLFPSSCNTIPSGPDKVLQSWRNTMLGKQDLISTENEQQWRQALKVLCKKIIIEARQGIKTLRSMKEGKDSPTWLRSGKGSVGALWKEEIDVAVSVIDSLEQDVEF